MGEKEQRKRLLQELLPIKNISNGMIETKDGRFIKVLEITPTNFRFFSDMAKDSVIATFASLLKIAPVNIQIKTITRRADTEGYIDKIQEELLGDEPDCREFAQKYIDLLRDIGRNEALNRKYYLIFEYERQQNQLRATENQIYAAMQKIEGNIRSILEQCQNHVVQHDNDNHFLASSYIPILIETRRKHLLSASLG